MSEAVSDQELARLREAARLLAEVVELGENSDVTDEQLEKHSVELARWIDGAEPESVDLVRMRAEHAYLVGMASPEDLRTMRQELAREHEGARAETGAG